jgi:hypothetical protein
MHPMTENCVTLEKDNGIALVTLNRPEKRNALDMPMFRAIDVISRQLRKDRAIRAVIVKANGEDFCSGLDIGSVLSRKSSALALLAKWWPGKANLVARRGAGPAGLVLAGHTHGGQWRLPGLPVLVRMSRYRLDEGRYFAGDSQLVVSRGLGATGLPFRMGCPPEAVLLTLQPRRSP